MKRENVIFGLRPVIEAIKSGKEIEKLFVQEGLKGELFYELRNLLKIVGKVPLQYVPIERLNRIMSGNHQGIICFISPIIYQSLENLLPNIYEQGKMPLLLILDKITDVRNMGAIARTAECAGVNAIIVPKRGSAQINADAVKTSAGALYKIPVCREDNIKNTIHFLKNSGLQIISCTEKGEETYNNVSYTNPTAIIVGSEEDGVSQEYLKLSDSTVKIPLMGEIESLNVSVATGIILYEVIRQRKIQ